MTTNVNLGFVADAGGTVNAITAFYTPTYTVLVDKMLVWFRATGANTSTTPTFSPNGLTARTIVKQGGQPLAAGDIPGAGAVMEMVYDSTNTRWELVNPASSSASYSVYTALLTQTGTNAPVATVLENTLGGTPTYARTDAGVYTITLANAWVENKTWTNPPSTGVVDCIRTSVNVLTLLTDEVDDELDGFSIEIRVYP